MPSLATKILLSTLLLGNSFAIAQAKPALADIFTGDMLGANLRYFESIAGPARTSYGDNHEYQVEGCNILITAAGGQISALSMELSDRCHVDLADFIAPDYATPASAGRSLAAYAKHIPDLSFYSYCIQLCGNAADPTIDAMWTGGRAQGFIEVQLEMVIADKDAIEASDQWKDLMLKTKGEDYIFDTRFNCEQNHQFNKAASQLFASLEVNRITIGHGLTTPPCQ